MNKSNTLKQGKVNSLLFEFKYIYLRSSYKGRMVNALALGAEEGRDKLR